MNCRVGCGACCIAPSISTPYPGHPRGKPAGVRCAQLSDDYHCRLYGDPRRPAACILFRPMPDVCGASREEAMQLLAQMEADTAIE
jgi:Fe-S-cluster containining protein